MALENMHMHAEGRDPRNHLYPNGITIGGVAMVIPSIVGVLVGFR